MKHLTI